VKERVGVFNGLTPAVVGILAFLIKRNAFLYREGDGTDTTNLSSGLGAQLTG
jgi:hypothetical protein